jgi:hypothetical protein
MKKYLITAGLMAIFFGNGCATAGRAVEPEKNVYTAPENKPDKFEAGSIVVRAKRLTKLEKLKKEAVRKNNKQTVEIASATAAAIAAFAVSDSMIRTGSRGLDQLASLGATAGAAYLTAIVAGGIYDFFTK